MGRVGPWVLTHFDISSIQSNTNFLVGGVIVEWKGVNFQISYTFEGIWNSYILLIWNIFKKIKFEFLFNYFIQTRHFSMKKFKFFK